MLDKSIPYFNVILKKKRNTPLTGISLPKGFHFDLFKPGDENRWAEIENSVLEFPKKNDALSYFKRHYLIYPYELRRRCIFISTEKGEKVGTATSWWSSKNGQRISSLHWVAIKPDFQNLGLGKAIVYKALGILRDIDGDNDIYLHTQTWSYTAIGIYLKAGFKILQNGSFGKYQNDYESALPFLKIKMGNKISIEEKHLL